MSNNRIYFLLKVISAIYLAATSYWWIHDQWSITDMMFLGALIAGFIFIFASFSFSIRVRENSEKMMARQLRHKDDTFSSLFNSMPMAVTVLNRDGTIERSNPASYLITGHKPDHYSGSSFINFVHQDYRQAVEDRFRRTLEGEIQSFDLVIRNHIGYDLELQVTSVPVVSGKAITGVIAIYQDVTVKRRTEERIKHLAYYDDLTGLPNRRMFRELVTEEIRSRKNGSIYVLLLNIDRFKFVNSSLGQDIGDVLLLQLADRLQQSIGDKGITARMEGDEFAILIKSDFGEFGPAEISKGIFQKLEPPFPIQQYSIHITVSIGIAECAADCDCDELDVIKNAGTALSRAKEKGKNHFELFTSEMNETLVTKFSIENDLRTAIQEEQLFLLYQPQFRIETGEMIGTEALIRWRHPERGIIPPGEFIPIAEESGLIVPLSEWVLQEACRQNKEWQDNGYPPIPVSVNMSMRQFLQPNLSERIQALLEESGLEPQYLELEITESMTMDVDFATVTLVDLKKLGIRISIDDFGTGYSSLNYLKNFPVDKLKIDRSFVRDILEDPHDAAIVRTIITMAHHLKQKVIAEGVETEQQLGFLRQYACDEIQGYLMSPPVSEDKIRDFLHVWRETAAGRSPEGGTTVE